MIDLIEELQESIEVYKIRFKVRIAILLQEELQYKYIDK